MAVAVGDLEGAGGRGTGRRLPLLAVRGKGAVVAFTRQRGESSEILVRDWDLVFPPTPAPG